ncbi:hypothetical protein BFJ63_vAg17371 [Fusarium oxysporum f. sp. narcissi]|uniref:Uncharacterized protein n=1 Tax=Fusarium oxysporum f. sp. narcissi TaxID=451672 RepID=A0A4Q2V537_FUSOX|nr:hypothetical protein BFJ63_vAg17371 [Fusarium oxysporum f. sp. narcissi]
MLSKEAHALTLTGYTAEKLPGETLDLAIWIWSAFVLFQEFIGALTKQVHNHANVASVLETHLCLDALVLVLLIMHFEGFEYPKLVPRGITTFFP